MLLLYTTSTIFYILFLTILVILKPCLDYYLFILRLFYPLLLLHWYDLVLNDSNDADADDGYVDMVDGSGGW